MEWKAIFGTVFGSRPAPAEAGPVRIYVFRGFRDAVSSAAAGPDVLRAFGNLAGLSTMFGGYVTYGRLFSSNDFLGVWGHRNAARFRRILRERLGEVEVVHATPPARRSGASITWHRPSREERVALERAIKGQPPSA